MVKKVACVAAVIVLIASAVSYADPLMTLDLRIAGGAKSMEITSAGQTVDLELYALLPLASDSLSQSVQRLYSVESDATKLLGDYHDCVITALDLFGDAGTPAQYDSNTDDEWGGAFPANFSNAGYIFNSSIFAETGSEIKLATIKWTATTVAPGADVHLNADYYMGDYPSDTSTQQSGTSNGVDFDFSDISELGVGSDVVLYTVPVPEPATLVMLVMGALALVVIRRRK